MLLPFRRSIPGSGDDSDKVVKGRSSPFAGKSDVDEESGKGHGNGTSLKTVLWALAAIMVVLFIMTSMPPTPSATSTSSLSSSQSRGAHKTRDNGNNNHVSSTKKGTKVVFNEDEELVADEADEADGEVEYVEEEEYVEEDGEEEVIEEDNIIEGEEEEEEVAEGEEEYVEDEAVEEEETDATPTVSYDTPENIRRREAVKAGMKHAWKGYKEFAWGHDELRPISRTFHDWVPGGIGMTIVDSLDTLIIMGLQEEYKDGRDWIASSLSFDRDGSISVFETNIRVVGGLLASYDLTGDRMFLDKCIDIADRLLHAFNSPSGIPFTTIHLRNHMASNPSWNGGKAILAEFGTLQLEFAHLSKVTGNPIYAEKALHIYDLMENLHPADGLFPIYMDQNSLSFSTDLVTMGAMGDSFYEYLLKVWVLSDKKDARARRMYDDAMDGMLKHMVRTTSSGLTYIGEYYRSHTNGKMDHLACFAAGMLALGAEDSRDGKKAEHMRVADGVARSCYEMYRMTATGLAPEVSNFGDNISPGGAQYYIKRPEAVEAFFYMWRLTHDEKYRNWGWDVYQALERHCRVDSGGFTGLDSATVNPPPRSDHMQSFALAETFKYLYLLFAEDNVIPLDKYVFNTEAHPFLIHKS